MILQFLNLFSPKGDKIKIIGIKTQELVKLETSYLILVMKIFEDPSEELAGGFFQLLQKRFITCAKQSILQNFHEPSQSNNTQTGHLDRLCLLQTQSCSRAWTLSILLDKLFPMKLCGTLALYISK